MKAKYTEQQPRVYVILKKKKKMRIKLLRD